MTLSEFSPIRNVSKSAQVFNKLRDAIWAGELPPGTPIREIHIAKQLHVSQVPVREALLRLEHLGLVVRVPDKGAHVTKLSRADMLELLAVRSHLEELAFRLAAKRMTPAIEGELRRWLVTIEEASANADHFAVAEADLRFHETVWRASGNTCLAETLDRLCISVYAFVSLSRHASGDSHAVTSHGVLLDALLQGDSKLISKSIREHLNPDLSIPANVAD